MSDQTNSSAALKDPVHVTSEEKLGDPATEAKRRAVTQGLNEEQTVAAVKAASSEQERRADEAQEAADKMPAVVGVDA